MLSTSAKYFCREYYVSMSYGLRSLNESRFIANDIPVTFPTANVLFRKTISTLDRFPPIKVNMLANVCLLLTRS